MTRQRQREPVPDGLTHAGHVVWIGGAPYLLRRMKGFVRVMNQGGEVYVCSTRGCTCPAYQYSKPPRKSCKHFSKLREVGVLPA